MQQKPYYPVGIQNFSELRSLNAVYVDKTKLIYQLTHSSKYVFLSRPRRFGKSLLSSTLRYYFQGCKDLFKGLAMENLEKEWAQYPVLHFDFSNPRNIDIDDMERVFALKMADYEDIYGRDEREVKLGERLRGLIKRAYRQTGQQVVALFDEYDSPLLDVLSRDGDIMKARSIMRDFYSPLKECDEYLRFVFITGISTFSQVSIFSELNNLKIISRDETYSTICGITKQELIDNFKCGIEELSVKFRCTTDEIVTKLTDYYDGYHFCGNTEGVFNPYSLLMAFDFSKFECYWFSTATPIFLIDMLRNYRQAGMFNLEMIESDSLVSPTLFETPIEQTTGPIPLLYQSGYLTIKGFDSASMSYTLGIPNSEVRVGLMENLLPLYSDINSGTTDIHSISSQASAALRSGDVDRAMKQFKSILESVPFMRGDKNILADEEKTEAYYHRIFYLFFRMLYNEVYAEIRSAKGAADITIRTPKYMYIVEIKINSSADAALRQIEEKGYAVPYLSDSRQVRKIGINFSTETRNITDWKEAPVTD